MAEKVTIGNCELWHGDCREVLPLLHELAGVSVAAQDTATDYPGYPLVASVTGAAWWFYVALPVLALAGGWLARRRTAKPLQNWRVKP